MLSTSTLLPASHAGNTSSNLVGVTSIKSYFLLNLGQIFFEYAEDPRAGTDEWDDR